MEVRSCLSSIQNPPSSLPKVFPNQRPCAIRLPVMILIPSLTSRPLCSSHMDLLAIPQHIKHTPTSGFLSWLFPPLEHTYLRKQSAYLTHFLTLGTWPNATFQWAFREPCSKLQPPPPVTYCSSCVIFFIAYIYMYTYYIYTYAFIIGPYHYTLTSMTADIFVYFVHCHILRDSQDDQLAQVGTKRVLFWWITLHNFRY